MVTDSGEILVAQGKYMITVGGGQPGTQVPTAEGHFDIKGQIVLPE
jgi:beta-glucosidase